MSTQWEELKLYSFKLDWFKYLRTLFRRRDSPSLLTNEDKVLLYGDIHSDLTSQIHYILRSTSSDHKAPNLENSKRHFLETI